ncbi:MAG: NADPH2:quinone reductase [Halieaceae bacterium]|jgi:NADPH2:quinone reductase
MRAVVCSENGSADKLKLEADWPEPAVGDNDVLIDVKAAGINFPDVLMMQGKYQHQPELPYIPGGECAGVVSAVGAAVTQYKIGDEVVTYGGSGAFCEKMTAHEGGVFSKPKGLDFAQAAGVSVNYFTSYYALKQRAELKAGETLLVLGAGGGVGITAVEIGKLMGARVIAAASSEEKLQLARDVGADETINYSEVGLKDAVKELTGGRGADVVYDPVGGDYSEQALRATAWKGRFLVIGFAAGPIPKIPLNLALLKGCSIVGVFWGASLGKEPEVNEQNIRELWEHFESGRLKPMVADRFALHDYEKAFNSLIERKARGKVILEITAF